MKKVINVLGRALLGGWARRKNWAGARRCSGQTVLSCSLGLSQSLPGFPSLSRESWSVAAAERSHGLRGGIFQINAWDGEVSLRDADRPDSAYLREISRSLLPPEPPRPCPSRCSHPWYEFLYVSCSQSFYFAGNLLIQWDATGF